MNREICQPKLTVGTRKLYRSVHVGHHDLANSAFPPNQKHLDRYFTDGLSLRVWGKLCRF